MVLLHVWRTEPYESGEAFMSEVCDLKAHLQSITEKNRSFYSDPRGIGALKDLQQTFPNPWLYVAELLQNAVDEHATMISATVREDGAFVFEHNGKAFTAEDVEALCARGVSAKGANTVGFMGVGFKSVFRSFESVQISSAERRFVLTVPIIKGEEYGDQQRNWIGAVLPRWDDSALPPSAGMTCRFVLSGRLQHLPAATNDLERVLGNSETLLALLAWQGVKEIYWDEHSWSLRKTEFQLLDTDGRRVLLEALPRVGKDCRRWVLFEKSFQPSRQAIARFLEHRQLSPSPQDKDEVYATVRRRRQVAAFCEIDQSGCPLPPERGSAFALLPTGVTFPMGLHLQADWLLVVTRRDLMQIEGNEWHEEILQQVPTLISYYLEWLVTLRTSSTSNWTRGYQALPGTPSSEQVADEWFRGDSFVRLLHQELKDLKFLPDVPNEDGSVGVQSPLSGRFLPKSFARELEEFRPELLFGSGIINSRLLGSRAMQCLERLDLLTQVSVTDLVNYWQSGAVGRWLELFTPDSQLKMLAKVLDALVELTAEKEWNDAALVCLPTAAGTWTKRSALSRYPADWNVLAQNEEMRSALEPLLGEQHELLSWDFDSLLQQNRSSARTYVDAVVPPKLDEVVDRWWSQLPTAPNPDVVSLIIRFSTWVLEKQPQRKSLVKKLMCVVEAGDLRLQPTAQCLITDPYAGSFRRLFFPGVPSVAPAYESQSSNSARSDWRAFFEKLEPAPLGRFSLTAKSQMRSSVDLSQFVGGDYKPPYRRASWMATNWRGFAVQSSSYTVVDFSLPSQLSVLLQRGPSREQFVAIAQWLAESPGQLPDESKLVVAYIPYMSSWVNTERLPNKADWVRQLNEAAWAYSRQGNGPYRPCEILAFVDAARPDAPVIDFPSELTEVLQRCGIEFGVALPDAPAIDRLRIEGPTATPDDLVELLTAAIRDAETDPAKAAFLRRILLEDKLLPVPAGIVTIDRATRLGLGRVVQDDRPRSLLGNWLVATESCPEGSSIRTVYELAASFGKVANNTTFLQVLGFLTWVWSSELDAEAVRRFLPRAYSYVRDDVQSDPTSLTQWNESVGSARVFVQRKKKWVKATGNDELFLDDLNERVLERVSSRLALATPGHLGDNNADQVSVAKLLGIRLLSSRFRVTVEPTGAMNIPERWQSAFAEIQGWLRARLSIDESSDEALEKQGIPLENLRLSLFEAIRTVVYDFGTPVQTESATAAFLSDGTIAVCGTPESFAEELCRLLFDTWGLRLRRDLVELIPTVAIQLTKIDQFTPHSLVQTRVPQVANAPSEDFSRPQDSASEPALVLGDSSNDGSSTSAAASTAPVQEDLRPGDEVATVEAGGSYTADDREARIRALVQKREELNRKITDALTLDVLPPEEPEAKERSGGEFRSDDPYRHAACQHEIKCGRFPLEKSSTQSGHDLDSYTHPEGHPDRKLIRRIEVKGRSTRWDQDEIVEMSDIQFKDSLHKTSYAGEGLDLNFDYWLYVVERQDNGELHVIPLRNVAHKAATFGLRGGSWRHVSENGDPSTDKQM